MEEPDTAVPEQITTTEPQTSDSNALGVWVSLLAGCSAILTGITIVKKKSSAE